MDTEADSGAEPLTDRVHDGSWSANLERERHADDPELVVAEALDAVAHTVAGTHVNLVTHGEHGHPETYLYPALDAELSASTWTYVDRCGCGGHVTRVHVGEGDGATGAEPGDVARRPTDADA